MSDNWLKIHYIYKHLKYRNIIGILLPKKNILYHDKEKDTTELKLSFPKTNKIHYSKIDAKTKGQFIEQILASLHALHSSKIIHRNINYDTWVIRKNKIYMRIDLYATFHFLSKSYQKIKSKYLNPKQWATIIAPELGSDDFIDYGMEIDIWNTGVVIFKLIFNETIKIPFTTEWLLDYIQINKSKWQQIPDGDIFIKIMRHFLCNDTGEQRMTSYAAKNMAEIPNAMIYSNDKDELKEDKYIVDTQTINTTLPIFDFLVTESSHIGVNYSSEIIFNYYDLVIGKFDILTMTRTQYSDIISDIKLDSNIKADLIYSVACNIAINSKLTTCHLPFRHSAIRIIYILRVMAELILFDEAPAFEHYKEFGFKSKHGVINAIVAINLEIPDQVRLL